MVKKSRSAKTSEEKSASMAWHLAHDYLLPVVNSHIKILKNTLSRKGLSDDERYDIQFKITAWEELKKEMS